MAMLRPFFTVMAGAGLLALPSSLMATDYPVFAPPEAGMGQPDGRMGIQTQVTELGQMGGWFNDVLLLPMMAAIVLFVVFLLLWVILRYRVGANPTPSRVSHNTFIEVIWTAIPLVLLLVIAVPSFRLLARQYDPPKADLTIKATGHQWYWSYDYPDHGDLSFEAFMLSDEAAKAKSLPRLLETDNRVVVPAGAVVKVLVTSADVIHSWAVPAFWQKMDAVPGRINETWFKVDRPGVYYGQCSELCGTRHGFMPITVEVMAPDKFNAWMDAMQKDQDVALSGPRYAADADGKLRHLPSAAPASEAAEQGAKDAGTKDTGTKDAGTKAKATASAH